MPVRSDGVLTAGDDASNWTAFAPVFSDWVHASPPPPPPLAPVIVSFSPDTGGVDPTSSIVLAGTAEASSTVTVYDGTSKLGTTAVDTSGNWSFTENNAANGVHTFTATDTDANGTSSASPPFAVTVNVPNNVPNIVTNGGFETGNLTGWTLGGNYTSTTFGSEIFINTNAESGTYAASMGSVGSDGTLSQSHSYDGRAAVHAEFLARK